MKINLKIIITIALALTSLLYFNLHSFKSKKIKGNKKTTEHFVSAVKDAPNVLPIAIIGSGPAGYSAAIATSRGGFHTVVFEGPKPGGQLMSTTYVENWPGIPKSLGSDIMKNFKNQAKSFGTLFSPESIEKVVLTEWPFKLYTNSKKEISALSIIVATGTTPNKLNVPGERKYFGKGLMSCAVCDSPFTKDSKVILISDNLSSSDENHSELISSIEIILEQVTQLAVYAREILILLPSNNIGELVEFLKQKLKEYPQVTFRSNVHIKAIKGDESKVNGVEIIDNNTNKKEFLKTDWIFLATGQKPNSQLFQNQLKFDNKGFIKLACYTQETSVPGVFSAGNVSNGRYRQASAAAGDGVKAGLDTINFIRKKLQINEKIANSFKDRLYIPDLEADHENSKLKAITSKKEFEDDVANKLDKLLIFAAYSPLCNDCKQVMPIFEKVLPEYEDKIESFKINIIEAQPLVKFLELSSVPTFIFYYNGKQISKIQLDGTINKDKIKKILDAKIKSLDKG